MKRSDITSALIVLGMILLAAGIVAPLIAGLRWEPYKYIFAAGAASLLVGRLFTPREGTDQRLLRLQRLETWSAVIYAAGAVMLFVDSGTLRDAVAFTMAGALVQLYASVMIPIARRKAQQKALEADEASRASGSAPRRERPKKKK